MTARDLFALTLLVILLREAAMTHDEWEADRDSGDESDGEYERGIEFVPDFAWLDDDEADEPRTVPNVCPKCGGSELRFANDLSFWCWTCDEGFFPTPEAKAA